MKKHWPYLLIALVLAACSGDDFPPPPDEAIGEQRFVTVLVDMHLVEAAINQKYGRDTDTTGSVYGYYRSVFAQHETSKAAFDLTYDYYTGHPALLLKVYEQVEDSLRNLSEDLVANEEYYLKLDQPDTVPAAPQGAEDQ